MPSLFLVDAMALIYRAHFAFQKNPRLNSKGLNTGCVFGFANSIFEVLNKEKPSHIAVAFDTKAPTFRHEAYTPYKAQRQKQPEDIGIGIPYILRFLEAMRIPAIGVEGYEADDVVGTLAQQAAEQGFKVYMMTMDKDYGQLVTDNIFLYKLSFSGGQGTEVWGIPEVCNRWGIKRPEQLTDVFGLQGDSSDNIPGIPGVGEKTAIKLIQEYDTLENLLANANDIKGKMGESIRQFAEQGLLSKHLATIHTQVPVTFNAEQFLYDGFDAALLKPLFQELEFRTFSKKLFGEDVSKSKASQPEKNLFSTSTQGSLFGDSAEKEAAQPLQNTLDNEQPSEQKTLLNINTYKHHFYLMDSPELVDELINYLREQPEFCFDTETTDLDATEANLVGLSFCARQREAYYVPVPKTKQEAIKLVSKFKDLFENTQILKIGQNLKYDISVLKNYDLEVEGPFFDTMLAHYILEPDLRHGMDYLAETYLNYEPIPIEQLIGKKGKNQGNMADVPVEKVCEYACEDAEVTYRLKQLFEPQLQENKMGDVFYKIETPLIAVLADMERYGVCIDTPSLKAYSVQLEAELGILERKIHTSASEVFNVQSPKQLGDILFEKLKLDPKAKKTDKTKQYATGEEVLSKLKDSHPIVEQILEYRELQKLKSTYIDALPQLISPRDGRVHTSYNQAVAATGRLSSNNPNLQNIPIRTERGREIRKAFVPQNADYEILSADYSQIELRIMAAFSQDESMLEAFRTGRDIHTATAAKLYKIPIEDVTSDMRRKAKTANFGIIYGISASGLSDRLSIPRSEASQLIKAYFDEFTAVKNYMDEVINQARSREYVETLLGRRRYLRDINSRNFTQRGFAERNAINAPIQGSAADIIKVAMTNIHQWFKKNKVKSKMIMQVHDELVFELHQGEKEWLGSKIAELMSQAIDIGVPLEVSVGLGQNWLEAH